MKIAIDKIKVTKRIRKDVGIIDELAENIREHGLIAPIAVMHLDGGEYQLLAGLRRLRAMELNGETEIDAKVFPTSDAEEALKIEYFENEQREPFTLVEKIEYAAIIAEIEKAKSLERMRSGKPASHPDPRVPAREGARNRTDAIVGDKVGMKESSYRYARYIAEKSPETIQRIDNGEIPLRTAYDELRAKEKNALPPSPAVPIRAEPVPDPKRKEDAQSKTPSTPASPKPPTARSRAMTGVSPMDYMSKQEAEAIRKLQEFDALPPEGKIAELQRQLKEERARAATAESELAREKEQRQIENYHKDANIENLKGQIAALEAALAAATARISELEGKYETNQHTA